MTNTIDPRYAGIYKQRQGFNGEATISLTYSPNIAANILHGDVVDHLSSINSSSVDMVMTSPPYNIGKSYEKRISMDKYLEWQEVVLSHCVRVLKPGGSICWQVGNHISEDGEVFPLDIIFYPIIKKLGLKLMGRIVWRLEHGLHAKKKFSGRHETILWFVKPDENSNYKFDFENIRIPQKYPGKKSTRTGEYSGNINGKNPGDVWDAPTQNAFTESFTDFWENVPNVKHNHSEKTGHPAQYPIEIAERLIMAVTVEGDVVLDPFLGSGSTMCAALLHNRKSIGIEIVDEYIKIAIERAKDAMNGVLVRRPAYTPVYIPKPDSSLLSRGDVSASIENVAGLFD